MCKCSVAAKESHGKMNRPCEFYNPLPEKFIANYAIMDFPVQVLIFEIFDP